MNFRRHRILPLALAGALSFGLAACEVEDDGDPDTAVVEDDDADDGGDTVVEEGDDTDVNVEDDTDAEGGDTTDTSTGTDDTATETDG